MTSDSFFKASGASPPEPVPSPRAETGTTPPDLPPLPPDLVDELARILAAALVADITKYPHLAALSVNDATTPVGSTSTS